MQYVTLFGNPGGLEYLEGETLKILPMPTRLFVNNRDADVAACRGHLEIIQSPLLGLNHGGIDADITGYNGAEYAHISVIPISSSSGATVKVAQ
ncbi:hypothetical protein KDN34_16395 [Shewanella yunxiaonensis]|uniref:Uncharacterized protein n=1 Tax=Shewanella yunxiaonensis TaxID=2829809 RepID=A0ABX7YTP0_9GAMM|nr:hypothetical protein [Shewanella yunxiaonensis]QUN05735.1 hypothetical protein KDN34_16395 [Shewanella yunxiaonensis]